jgi:hypothetical protein
MTSQSSNWLANSERNLSPTLLASAAQRLTHDLKLRGTVQKAYLDSGGVASDFEALSARALSPEIVTAISNPAPLIFALGRSAEAFALESAKVKATEHTMPPALRVGRKRLKRPAQRKRRT